MARHDDRDRVRPDRAADRTAGGLATGAAAELAVGDDFAPFEVDELLPHRELEGGAGERDRQVEVAPVSVEVLLELGRRGVEHGVARLGEVLPGEVPVALDREGGDGGAVADDLEASDGAVDAAEVSWGLGSHVSRVTPASDTRLAGIGHRVDRRRAPSGEEGRRRLA